MVMCSLFVSLRPSFFVNMTGGGDGDSGINLACIERTNCAHTLQSGVVRVMSQHKKLFI